MRYRSAMPDPGDVRINVTATSHDVVNLAERLDAFASVCRKRRGLRVVPQDDGFVLWIDTARIEAVGPIVEAAADAYGLGLRLEALDAEVRSAGLEARQSGIWAAIGNAVDEERGRPVPR